VVREQRRRLPEQRQGAAGVAGKGEQLRQPLPGAPLRRVAALSQEEHGVGARRSRVVHPPRPEAQFDGPAQRDRSRPPVAPAFEAS
jgi:hypothetical protein